MINRTIVPSIALALTTLSGSAFASVNPWDFNVFSRGNIGAPGVNYGSDFQGAAGAVGSAWFGGFSLRDVNGSSPSLGRSWYSGGSFNSASGTVYGAIEAAGGVNVSSHTVTGSVYSGAGLAGSGGTINGSANIAGTNSSSITINGGVFNVPFTSTLDVNAVSAYFLSASATAQAQSSTTFYTNFFGTLTVNTTPGLTVVDITAADLDNAHTVVVNGSGSVIFNVSGLAASLGSTTWTYQNGASSASTLLNYYQATSLALSGGNIVNLLAPHAATTFYSGHLDGNLIVGSLMGGNFYGGQVNWTGSGYTGLIPTPAAATLLVLGGLAAGRRRR